MPSYGGIAASRRWAELFVALELGSHAPRVPRRSHLDKQPVGLAQLALVTRLVAEQAGELGPLLENLGLEGSGSGLVDQLARALELVDKTGARGVEPQILEQRAELARLLGDESGYQSDLREAHRLFVEMGATGHARRVAAQL